MLKCGAVSKSIVHQAMIFFMEGKWDGGNIAYFPAFQYPWLDRQMLDLVLGGVKDLRRKITHDD